MDPRAKIRDIGLWREPPHIEKIGAGYTNENFRVFSGGETFFARAGEDLPHHGISRRNEASCVKIAAEAGIAPEVVFARGGVLVTRFVEGTSLKLGDAHPDATVAAVARLLARVHRLPAPPDLGDADLVGACRRYLTRPESDRLQPTDRVRIEAVLAAAPVLELTSFVHGDAFPENFIDDGRRLWLIDWEYAGRGHPAADLAYAAMNLELSDAGIRMLVAAHGGTVDAGIVRALVDVAAARDILWCVAEIAARGLTETLRGYAERCFRRLGVAASMVALEPRGAT